MSWLSATIPVKNPFCVSMNPPAQHMTSKKWLHVLCAAGLLITFFLPWVAWKESIVSGYYLPAGKFFHISETKFGLANPFPQFNFTFYVFWLIPALAALTLVLAFQNKKTSWAAFIVGALGLSLVTLFFLFTKTLIDLGVGANVFSMLKIPVYLAAFFSIGLILTVIPNTGWLKKTGWLIVGPVFTFLGFMLVENYIWGETHTDTNKAKADYSVQALSLIREFAANDSAANNKYREKIVVVDGTASSVEQLSDSTINIQFTDTTGSYIIFSFDKDQYEQVKNIKPGDPVSAKGSCSGSIYSEILGTSSISFKRSTLNKTTQK